MAINKELGNSNIAIFELIETILAPQDCLLSVLKQSFTDDQVDSIIKDPTSFAQLLLDRLKSILINVKPVDRVSTIILARYGVGYDKKITLRELGDRFYISRERIRQIEQKSMKKLRSRRNRNEICKAILLSACSVIGADPESIRSFIKDRYITIEKIGGRLPDQSRIISEQSNETRIETVSIDDISKVDINALISDEPITLSQFVRNIKLLFPSINVNENVIGIGDLLIRDGYLNLHENNGKFEKTITDKSINIGISNEHRINPKGDYYVNLYNADAKRFILKNYYDFEI